VDVKIQDSEPPTQDVIEAFKAVETAKQQAETVVNDAKAYQNAKLPDAQAQVLPLYVGIELLQHKMSVHSHGYCNVCPISHLPFSVAVVLDVTH
jgi:hypothetical protein